MNTLMPREQVLEHDDDDKIERLEALRLLRKKIRPYFKMLDKVPNSDLEKVLASEDQDFPGYIYNRAGVIEEAEKLLMQLMSMYEQKEIAIRNEWNNISKKWTTLESEVDLSLDYAIGHPDIEKLKTLNQALSQRAAEKASRLESIAVATKDLRDQLKAIWEACHIYEEDKSHFLSRFTSENFSEDLYEDHRTELQVWKNYQKRNRALLDKLARRQQMWKDMMELESRADDPTRFTNRGATLLKDQNNLTSIRKHLPKIEEELLKLATKFAIQHGGAFKIHGKEIATLIDEDWAKFREERSKKKFERNGSNGIGSAPAPTPVIGLTPRKRPAPPAATPCPYKK